MLPILHLGPLALPTAQFILLAGLWLGLDLSEKQAERYGVKPAAVYTLTLIMLVAGAVGGRLVYAAQAPGAFLANPLNLFALSPQMFDGTGGLVVAVLAGAAYLFYKRLALLPALDALVTLLSVLAIALGLAHLASGDAFGAPAHLPWAITLWGEQRHPSQVYEILAGLMIAILVWPGGRFSFPSETGRWGFRFWSFIALSAGARLILETFRGDSSLVAGFRAAQITAWVVLAVSLWGLGRSMRERAAQAQNGDVEEGA